MHLPSLFLYFLSSLHSDIIPQLLLSPLHSSSLTQVPWAIFVILLIGFFSQLS